MERNINNLIGYHIEATDGELGKVEDFYFDDETWTIRYLVVKTGSWLSGRKVLISTTALTKVDIQAGLFLVNMTQEQIRTSPDIDADKPVSRQKEAMLNQHHIWGNYWGSGSYGGEMGIGNKLPVRIKEIDRDPNEDIHLRSIVQVSGYMIHASDGEIGHVAYFIVDDQTWKLVELVVDTHDWIGGKKVLVGVSTVHSISYLNWLVYVHMKIEDILACKLYEEAEYNQEA
jgi:sporulation protein YlmC with PRC-barrel domain